MLLLLLLRLEKGTEGREKKTAQTKKEDCIKEKNRKTNLKKKSICRVLFFLQKEVDTYFICCCFAASRQ